MRYLLLLLFFFLGVFSITAQDSTVVVKRDTAHISLISINEEDLSEFKNDKKFDYTEEKKENGWWDALKNWGYNILIKIFNWLFGVSKGVGYLASFFKIIPYLLLALVLYFIIRFFLNVHIKSTRIKQENKNLVHLSEEERIMKTEDIEQLIQNAVNSQNYRLAVRYYYLHILKLLTDKDLIAWQQQKTNDDYVKELPSSSLQIPFKAITKWYDYVWYGEFPISKERYTNAESAFIALKNTITKA